VNDIFLLVLTQGTSHVAVDNSGIDDLPYQSTIVETEPYKVSNFW